MALDKLDLGQHMRTVPAVLVILAVLVAISIGFEHVKDHVVHVAKKNRLERIVTVLFGGELAWECGPISATPLHPSNAELTLLGFIGLLVYAIQRADLLGELSVQLYGSDDSDLLPSMVESVHVRPTR